MRLKPFTRWISEDAPTVAAGHGAVAGLGVGPQGEPGIEPAVTARKRKKRRVTESVEPERFAGAAVFAVDMDKVMSSRFGKNRYHRYSKYVGNDEVGEAIRQHGRSTKDDIILKDNSTAVMTYLRRKKKG